jgi:hypothetical protein
MPTLRPACCSRLCGCKAKELFDPPTKAIAELGSVQGPLDLAARWSRSAVIGPISLRNQA